MAKAESEETDGDWATAACRVPRKEREKGGDGAGRRRRATRSDICNSSNSKKSKGKLLPVVQHVLSRELQVYFDRITALLRGGGGANGEERGNVVTRRLELYKPTLPGWRISGFQYFATAGKHGSPNESTKPAQTSGDDARDRGVGAKPNREFRVVLAPADAFRADVHRSEAIVRKSGEGQPLAVARVGIEDGRGNLRALRRGVRDATASSHGNFTERFEGDAIAAADHFRRARRFGVR